jgi:hypothetical protein
MPSAPIPPSPVWSGRAARGWGITQGLFYAITGLWPLVHLRSFLSVTGPKVDLWLVQTVGALLAVTGLALYLAARRSRLSGEWALLAGGQAAALATVDIVFVSRGRISPIYLLDAAVELVLVGAWLVLAFRAARTRRLS